MACLNGIVINLSKFETHFLCGSLSLLLRIPAKIQNCRAVLIYSPIAAQVKYLFSLDDFYLTKSSIKQIPVQTLQEK